ncbi:zinc finger protein 37 homolog [Folsomia candida]|uniref:zinc finger protein 37 homolog n=1 Tax=Folsomia candida TaxID=158441 RepID=UPI001604F5DE|nr:zinc finger protein 37 homolog [Folsomia candida]
MNLKPGKKWECPKCLKTFKAKYKLTRHIVRHDPDAKVKCEICGKISKNRLALSAHVSSLHTDRKRPSCDVCHRVFFHYGTLQRHIHALHNTEERPRFSCQFPGCEKIYKNRYGLSQHVSTEHAENPVRFPCTLCGKKFKRRSHLETHIHSHTTEKTYNCSTCGRSFAHKASVTQHEKTHLEKSARDMLQYRVCPQTFSSKKSLQGHIRVLHENQRNYPCAFCDKRFANTTNLKVHLERRHPTGKELIVYSCEKCEYRSHSKANLAAHGIRHNAARYECYFCQNKFFLFNILVKHCGAHTLEKL